MQTRSMDSAASAPWAGPDPPASLQLQHVGLNLLRITFTDIEHKIMLSDLSKYTVLYHTSVWMLKR